MTEQGFKSDHNKPEHTDYLKESFKGENNIFYVRFDAMIADISSANLLFTVIISIFRMFEYNWYKI